MPDVMNFKLHLEWIPKGTYEGALSYIQKHRKEIHVVDSSEDNLLIYFVARGQIFTKEPMDFARQQTISAGNVASFEATLQGRLPRGVTLQNFNGLVKAGLGIAKVYVSPDPLAQVLECEANPLNLMCLGCTGYHHRGICSHVLAATHMHYALKKVAAEDKPFQHNLRYMCAKLYGKTGRRSKHRPTNPGRGLQVDPDSSADEEDQISQARYDWWGS